MDEKPSYYAIIPANIRYDKTLRANEKLLYGEITALSSKYGECSASNNYFANLYEVNPSAISKWIKDLQNRDYIEVFYVKKEREIEKRIIKIRGIDKCDYLLTKNGEGYSQKAKENNTSINNINIKENIKKKSYGEFKKVLLSDDEYAKLEKSNLLTYINKLDSYIASKGKKYKSHYATILNWSRREMPDNNPKWMDEDIKDVIPTKKELDEMESILKEFKEE